MKSGLEKVGLLLIGTGLALVIAEGALRIWARQPDRRCVFPPQTVYTFRPDSALLPGCGGIVRFTTDGYGARDIPGDGKKQWLFIGGSTTECLYLDDSATWPALFCQARGESGYSIGKSGQTSAEHVAQLERYAPQLPEVKKVLVMCGLNDMLKVLSDTARCNNAYDDLAAEKSFTHTNQFASQRGWQLTALIRNVWRNAVPDTTGQYRQDVSGSQLRAWRANRWLAPVLIADSHFVQAHRAAGLQQFEKNLLRMIRAARAQQLSITFLTQQAAWRSSASEEEQKRWWMGSLGDGQRQAGCAYYSPDFLCDELARYNEVLQRVCARENITCIQLPNAGEHSTGWFYDDCHYNKKGAQKLSAFLDSMVK
ncbi:MAG: SGNH/GDSL hydrolase family protein [Chitinophagales bacterium]